MIRLVTAMEISGLVEAALGPLLAWLLPRVTLRPVRQWHQDERLGSTEQKPP